jgi:hypothetical protein
MKMAKKAVLLAGACLLAVSLLAVTAGDRPGKEKPRYAAMPWHLVDVWWDTGKDMPFESYSIDVTISDDVPATVNLYVAPVGLAHLDKTPFYGGLQTQADGYTRKDRKLRKIGRGLLFSMWGERSHDAIRASLGGYCQSSGHEGDFVSVRRAYAWKKGKYTYRLVRMDAEEIAGKPYTWVGAFLYAHETDENVFVGALRFKGKGLVLSRKVTSFVEVYGRAIPPSDIPKVNVTFGNLKVNGKAVAKPGAVAVYPKGVPDHAEAKGSDGAVVVAVGTAVEGRTRREVELLKP